jgi:hypothetical protein
MYMYISSTYANVNYASSSSRLLRRMNRPQVECAERLAAVKGLDTKKTKKKGSWNSGSTVPTDSHSNGNVFRFRREIYAKSKRHRWAPMTKKTSIGSIPIID